MSTILAIDPGTEESGVVIYDTVSKRLHDFAKKGNAELLIPIRNHIFSKSCDLMVIEMVQSYGMPVGQTTFETVYWTGRFLEAWGNDLTCHRIYRSNIKLHLCNSTRAKDGNVWQAILNRYGGKQKAVGYKKTPGPLYGVHKDMRQALAVAIYWAETQVDTGGITPPAGR